MQGPGNLLEWHIDALSREALRVSDAFVPEHVTLRDGDGRGRAAVKR